MSKADWAAAWQRAARSYRMRHLIAKAMLRSNLESPGRLEAAIEELEDKLLVASLRERCGR